MGGAKVLGEEGVKQESGDGDGNGDGDEDAASTADSGSEGGN